MPQPYLPSVSVSDEVRDVPAVRRPLRRDSLIFANRAPVWWACAAEIDSDTARLGPDDEQCSPVSVGLENRLAHYVGDMFAVGRDLQPSNIANRQQVPAGDRSLGSSGDGSDF